MKECIPQICNYEYCRQRSVDDKLFKEASEGTGISELYFLWEVKEAPYCSVQ